MANVTMRDAPPLWRARQFHVLGEQSHQHPFFVDLWDAVRRETGGRLDVRVHASSQTHGGADAMDMLRRGELEFYSINGNSMGVAPCEIQGVPYAFADSAAVHAANDGALGAYLTRECAAKGIHRFPRGLMENGFRQTYAFDRAIRTVDDLADLRIRVPGPSMIGDVMDSLGAKTVYIKISQIREALEQRRMDAHENPLIVMEVGGFHALTPFVSLTGHMWTGFNVIANLEFWNRLPADVQAIVDANVTKHVAAQRAYTDHMNRTLAARFAARGMTVTQTDTGTLKARLHDSGFYARWKAQLGRTAWDLLEAQVGPIG